MGKYLIKNTSNGQYRWTFHSNNGENIMTSETYTTKQACRDGITSSKMNVRDENFDRKMSYSNELYFNQRANNWQVLGTSEMYSSVYNREHAIAVVKAQAPTAEVIDIT